MRKHGGRPFRRDRHVTPAAISPPGVARGRFVGGQQSSLAGSKPPPLFTRGASSCSSQGRRQGEPRGASPRPSAPTYLPTSMRWGYFWVGVCGPGHSRVMSRAATMYGQSCMVVERSGVGPVRLLGASLRWGRRVTFHVNCSWEICQVRWVHLARQYIALPRSWLRLRMESTVSRDLRSHVPQVWGSSGSSCLVYVSGPGLCGGGGLSRRGGGSRCCGPSTCRLVRGIGWWRGCSDR